MNGIDQSNRATIKRVGCKTGFSFERYPRNQWKNRKRTIDCQCMSSTFIFQFVSTVALQIIRRYLPTCSFSQECFYYKEKEDSLQITKKQSEVRSQFGPQQLPIGHRPPQETTHSFKWMILAQPDHSSFHDHFLFSKLSNSINLFMPLFCFLSTNHTTLPSL